MSFQHILAIMSYMKSLSLSKPHLLIMTGLPGSGKSFFAEKFSDTFSAPFINFHYLQQVVEDPDSAGHVAQYMLSELMKTKQSLIVEGRSDSRKERMDFAKFARECGYEPMYIWVQTDPNTAKKRSAKVSKSATNRQLTPDEHDKISKKFTALSAQDKHIVISGRHTYASQAKVVLKKLSEPRTTTPIQSERPSAHTVSNRRNINVG